MDDLRLLTTELVANAIKHAAVGPEGRLRMRVEVDHACVRVEVTQPGPGFKASRRSPEPTDESGWGFLLVDLLTERWGVKTDPTTVWFETSRRPL